MFEETNTEARSGRDLLEATRPFETESALESWWHVGFTIVVLGATLALAAFATPWWIQLIAAILGGFILIRVFILYHDFIHRSLLRRSRIAKGLFVPIGLILLAPPRYWRHSHNFHHGNVGKPLPADRGGDLLVSSDLGSFPLMSADKWKNASLGQRLKYRVARSPWTLLFAYVTVFLFGLTLIPLVSQPKRYWDGAVAVLAHGGLIALLWVFAGAMTLFFAFLLPFTIASAIGAYLFFAQHNYEGMRVLKPDEWTYYRGATEASSYMRAGRILNWFTGNIGYHHVHHLNPHIPFYRLPQAMAQIPELQNAEGTSLRPQDVIACLRLNLWDSERERLVSYREARALGPGADITSPH